jgi:L-fucose mutarotase
VIAIILIIWSDFQQILKASGSSATLKKLERFAFFDAGKDHNVALTIATGEQRLYANPIQLIEITLRGNTSY